MAKSIEELDRQERKERPLYSGVLKYFPKALLEVAHTSYMGNEQHHPGTPLHWDKTKSTDEADALMRHLLQAGTIDTDGVRHSAKVAWRALALLERELDGLVPQQLPLDFNAEAVKRLKEKVIKTQGYEFIPTTSAYTVMYPCNECKGLTKNPNGYCDFSCGKIDWGV